MTDEEFTYFECDNAYFRRRNGLSLTSIHDVLHGDRWVPYVGDCLRPAMFGDRVPDPAPGARDALSVMLTAEGRRNIIQTGPESGSGTTDAMVSAARKRILDAGGQLIVWAVLQEDTYETVFGDSRYLHLHGVALDQQSAAKLAALGAAEGHPFHKWCLRDYRLILRDDMPFVGGSHTDADEWTINEFIRLLGEINEGQTASPLAIGDGRRLRLPDE